MFNDRYGLTQAVIEGRKTMAMMLINIKSTSDVQVRIFAGYVQIIGRSGDVCAKAELMPHQIRITGIKCERLQDISEEDCMKEGILGDVEYDKYEVYGLFGNSDDGFDTPREAFASLIDKVSGRGTWKRNPWVVAYEFELVK